MFEKWRIKEHMDVSDAAGQHLGTVDSVDGHVIKMTRSDSADGQHHFIDVRWVERIKDNRAYLSADAPLYGIGANQQDMGNAAAEGQAKAQVSKRQPRSAQAKDYDGQAALDAGFAGEQPSAEAGKRTTPLFGTSGHGTGMGGSGPT